MRLIDADALFKKIQHAEIEAPDLVCKAWVMADVANMIHTAPTVEYYGNIDISANAIFDIATREDHLYFRETDEMCPVCQRDLEVYYCENRTYIVRCKHCHIVTLVQAGNPYEATEKVGLHVKPVRHGRWIQSKTVPSYYHCSCCKRAHNMPMSCNVYVLPYYCMDCGAKMDLEVSGDA